MRAKVNRTRVIDMAEAETTELTSALATPDDDSHTARIEQLRAQVESGNYQVSADDLAKALIDSHLKD